MPGQISDTLDLSTFDLRPGEGRRLELAIKLGSIVLAGQPYEVGESGVVEAQLDISRTLAGYALRLRFQAPLSGACMRCLEPAAPSFEVDSREIDQPGDDDDLRSPYLEADELELSGWARDALALAVPAQLLCRSDCRGLCGVCGANLNDADPAEHRHESEGDPRWAKLRELDI